MDTHNLEEGTTEFSRDFDTPSRATYLRWYNAFWKIQRYFNVGMERQLAESMARINEYVYRCIDAQKDLDGDHLIARFLKVWKARDLAFVLTLRLYLVLHKHTPNFFYFSFRLFFSNNSQSLGGV